LPNLPRNWHAGPDPAARPRNDAADPDHVLGMPGSGREDRPETPVQEVQRPEGQSRAEDFGGSGGQGHGGRTEDHF